MKPSFSCGALVALAALSVTACSNRAPSPPSPPPSLALSWQRIDLPGAAGADLRDVVDCAGRWWVAGTAGAGPAAWSSTDATTWRPVPFEPLPTSYYGPKQVITSVACAGDRVAMIGSVPGGAHGNPRVSTWRLDGGRMRENSAPFETYGGANAVGVGWIAGGPAGFAIAGNRTSGGAAWFSADGRGFSLTPVPPDAAHVTMARDAVPMPDGEWAIVGGAAVRNSLDERAAVWLTRDGQAWTRADPPPATGFNELQRAVRQGDDILAAGVHDAAFVLFRWHAGSWTAVGDPFGGDPAGVRSLTVAGGKTVVAGGGLWIDGRAVAPPEAPVAVAGRVRTLVMASADRLWRTEV